MLQHFMVVIELSTSSIILTANQNFSNAVDSNLVEVEDKQHSMFCEDASIKISEYKDFGDNWLWISSYSKILIESLKMTKSYG
jgi:hypothetical protein